MGIAGWCWDGNLVRLGVLSAGSQVPGLGVANLQNEQGDPTYGWQTTGTADWLKLDALATRAWRVLLLARTNLTPAATIRWLLYGGADLLAPVAVPTDSNAGASLGPATTRNAGSDGGPAIGAVTRYTNAAGSAYVAVARGLEGGAAYEATLWMRRINGSSTAGTALMAEYPDAAGQAVRSFVPMTLLAQGTNWQLLRLRFTLGRSGPCTLLFAADTGALTYELGAASLVQVPVYDSGIVPAGVVPGIGQTIHVLPATTFGRLVRCDISDPGNPQGSLNVALACMGDLTQTGLNIAWGGGISREQGGSDLVTRGGAEWPRLDWTARTRDIEHDAILASEVWPVVMALDAHARRGANVLFVPDPDSPDIAREAIYGRLRSTAPVATPYQTEERQSWRATIRERL